MKNLYLAFSVLLVAVSCKESKPTTKQPEAITTQVKPIKEQAPNSCDITGRIVEVLPPQNDAEDKIFRNHSSQAMVQVLSIKECGVDVQTLGINDTILMDFAFTLSPTKKLFPDLEKHNEGLNTGDEFSARFTQRLTIGNKHTYSIYNYTKL